MRRRLNWAMLAAWQTLVCAQTESLPLLPSQYVVDEWTATLGFPEETVLDFGRSPNDHLWMGTARGLVRFDGRQFVAVYPNASKGEVLSVTPDPELGLYCAVADVGVQKLENGSLKTVWSFPLSNIGYSRLRRDKMRRLVLMHRQNLYREDAGEFHLWKQLPAVMTGLVEVDPGVWLLASQNGIWRAEDGKDPELLYRSPLPVESVVYHPELGVLASTRKGLYQFRKENKKLVLAASITPKRTITALAVAPTGEVWVGTDIGLHQLRNGSLIPFHNNLRLRREPVSSIYPDGEGNVWAAYSSGTIFRLRPPRFPNWSAAEGLSPSLPTAVLHDAHGGAWVSSRAGMEYINPAGRVRAIRGDWLSWAPRRLLADDGGSVLALGPDHLVRIRADSFTATPVPLPPSRSDWAAIFRHAGDIWILNAGGEFYTRGGPGGWTRRRIQDVPDFQAVLPGMTEKQAKAAVAETPAGELWFGLRGVGLYRLDGDRLTQVAGSQPESKLIHAIYADRQGSLWLGLDGAGLGMLQDGRIHTFAVDKASQQNSVFFIGENLLGELWLGLRAGLIRIRKDQLHWFFDGKLAEPQYHRYTALSGLPSGNFGIATDTSHLLPSRVLWLPHLRGVARVDTNHVASHATPPLVYIDSFVADGRLLTPSQGQVRIPAGVQRLQVSFHATFLPEPLRVTYKYQLVGFQQSPVGPYEQREATFTRLPPGSYTFHVWAANSDGVWNETGDSMAVYMEPAFYETLWFGLLMAALLGLGVYGGVQWRVRRLRQDKIVLESRVAARTTELEAARQTAERATKVKSEFLATMSHEIRTPLHGVLGTLELLAARPLTGDEREYVLIAKRSAESLLELLNDVLDLSRLEAGHTLLRPEEFDAPALFDDVIQAFRHAALGKGLDLRLRVEGLPPRLLGDRPRIRQILSNLVGNAIKFTDSGWVELRCIAEESEGQCLLRIAVQDTGMGIDPAKVRDLFQPFSRGDGSSTRRYGGTGLGLAISRRLAEEMRGVLSVESEPGKGAEFRMEVTLPLASPLATKNTDSTAPAYAALAGRVLLVEDNRVNQLLGSRMLAQLGCSVDIAADGIEGVERVASGAYDVVLMDCHMPRAGGVEATQMIRRASHSNAQVPIIALTASSLPEEREACTAAGMDGFLAKPYSLIQLHQALAPYLAPDGKSSAIAPVAPRAQKQEQAPQPAPAGTSGPSPDRPRGAAS